MNKVCVLFNSYIVNDETVRRFCHIQNGCKGVGYDIKWVIDTTNGKNEVDNLPLNIDVFQFQDKDLKSWMRLDNPNPNFYRYNYPILNFFELFPEYEYLWNIEYDVCFSGDWSTFFMKSFNDSKFDMIAELFSNNKPSESWCWWKLFDGDKSFPFWRNCGHMLARFSKRAVESAVRFFNEFNVNGKMHSELGYISACMRDGLEICKLENYEILCPGFHIAPMRPTVIKENKAWHAIKTDFIWPYAK